MEYFFTSSEFVISVQLSSDEVEDSWGVGLTILVHRLQNMGVLESAVRLDFLERCLYLVQAAIMAKKIHAFDSGNSISNPASFRYN